MSEELQILVEEDEITEDRIDKYVDVSHLKELKITSQVFLRVNSFNISDEPDFSELTEDQFYSFFEKNTNEVITKKLNDLNIVEDFRSSMSQLYTHNKNKNRIFVFFLPTSDMKAGVGIDVVKNFCKLVVLLGCNEGLMISEKPLTSKSRELLESSNVKGFCSDDVYNVISYTDDTFVNVVDHCLSPEVLHIYSAEEWEKFSEENHISSKELPKMLNTDPIAKFFRARVGDVVKMKRKTGTQNTLVNHQIVYRAVGYNTVKERK